MQKSNFVPIDETEQLIAKGLLNWSTKWVATSSSQVNLVWVEINHIGKRSFRLKIELMARKSFNAAWRWLSSFSQAAIFIVFD